MKLIGIGDLVLGERILNIRKENGEYFVFTKNYRYTLSEIELYVENVN